LLERDNLTYEYAPGAGVAYRLLNFKVSYDYTRTESYLGEEVLRHNMILVLLMIIMIL
jgi:hypothetical protein